jgi:competence protein ComEC
MRRRLAVEAPEALAWLSACWLVGLLCARGLGAGSWQAAIALCVFASMALGALWGQLPGHRERAVRGATRGDAGADLANSGVLPNAIAFAASTAAFVAGVCVAPAPLPCDVPPGGMARLQARVIDARSGAAGEQSRAVIRVLSGTRLEDGAALAPDTLLSAGPLPLPFGARVQLLAKIAPRLPFRNDTPHPPLPPRFALQGSAWIAGPQATHVLEAPWFEGVLDAARRRVRERLVATLSPQAASIARALVLGDDAAIAEQDQADVRTAGLLHVFAVSGLHVAILAGLCVALIERGLLRVTALAARCEVRRIACAIGGVLAIGYADFAGGAPSAWRAAITAALGWALIAIGRRPDARATTAMSALVLGAVDPAEAARPAFLLSIAATAAIVGGQRIDASSLTGAVHGLIALSVRAWIATAPIVLWCFGGLPVLGVLANVVMLPFASLLLVQLSAAHALLATCTPWPGPTAWLFSAVAAAFVNACGVFARAWPAAQWPPPDLWQGVVLAAAACSLLMCGRTRTRVLVSLAALCALSGLEWRLRAVERPVGTLRATFLDVGQGDAAIVDLPDGRSMLIDAGGNPGGGPDPGRLAVLPLLRARRRDRVDVGVLTHPHPDHYGGLGALIDAVDFGELWDSGQSEGERDLQPTSAEAAQLLARARKRGAVVRTPQELCDAPLRAGGAVVSVLAPCPRYDSAYDANDNSLVVRIAYGRRSFLLVGDAESHTEGALLARGVDVRADVLKVGHHGSRTSSSAAFLRAVAPKLAVISAGAGNRFGHPHPEVRERLRAASIAMLNTAETGSVTVETDGAELRVRTWSGEHMHW